VPWSYRTLSGDAARLFRLLGLHPGPDISRAAAASLAGLQAGRTRQLLTELTRAQLLAEHAPDRYSLHDLLRAYATNLTDTDDSPDARCAATHRTLDHYLHSAYAANKLLHPGRPLDIAAPQPGVAPERHSGPRQALDWFTAERPVLLALVARAAAGFDSHTWQLAWTLRAFLCQAGHWHDEVAACRAGLAAAGRLSDPYAQAWALRSLAGAYANLGRFDDADTHLRHALELTRAGDRTGQAQTHHNLGYLRHLQDRHAEALDHTRQALDLYQAANDRHGEAAALSNIGSLHAALGNYEQTLTYGRQALTLYQELDNRYGQAYTWSSLGCAYHHLDNHAEAITCHTRALDRFRDHGDRYNEATARTHLGDVHHDGGDAEAARAAWRQALVILDGLNHPDADDLRKKLDR
jgi:tetratricopeptide (TPR) repeat protein